MRVLVAVASKYGSTLEIARTIADVLDQGGAAADVVLIEDVSTFDGYDAVVLGSAVYSGRWMKEARFFARDWAGELLSRPLWLFSSGPLGDPPQPSGDQAVKLHAIVRGLKPREHRIFAGKLVYKHLGFGERAIVTAVHAPEGDFRNWTEIRTWAAGIAQSLKEGTG